MPVKDSVEKFGVYMGVTGLSLTITLSKAGGAFATVTPGVADRGNGWYSITPTAAHRDTLGINNWLFSDGASNVMPYAEEVTANLVNAIVTDAAIEGLIADAADAKTAAESADGKLSAGRLAKLDRDLASVGDAMTLTAGQRVKLDASQPDYAPAKAGDEMTLPAATLAELFSDADVAQLVNDIAAKFDGAEDLPVQAIAAKSAEDTIAGILANAQILALIADAAAAKTAAESADDKLSAGRLAKLDRDLASVGDAMTLTAAERTSIDAKLTENHGAGSWQTGSGGGGGGEETRTRLTATVRDSADTLIADAWVILETIAGEDTGEAARTNSSGVAVLFADDDDYRIRVDPPNGFEPPALVEVTLAGVAVTAEVVLTARTIAAPADPNLCAVAVDTSDQFGEVSETAVKVTATPIDSDPIAGGRLILPTKRTFAAADGRATLQLFRGVTYEITATRPGDQFASTIRYTVPDEPTAIATL